MNTCLNCKWLSEVASLHKWHQCGWPGPERVPKAVQVVMGNVNIQAPFRDCPAWEAASVDG